MKASLISDYYPFWLNEGHTVFLERKIMARLKGDPEAAGGGPRGQIYSDPAALGCGIRSVLAKAVDLLVRHLLKVLRR